MIVVWDEFLKIIKEEAGSQVVETWFKAVCLEDWNAAIETVTLRVPNQFVNKWIQEHYLELIKIHLGRLLHSKNLRIFFLCNTQELPKERNIIPASVVQAQKSVLETHSTAPDEATPPMHHSNVPAKQAPTKVAVSEKKARDKALNSINPQYVFDTFIVGPSNSLAHAAGKAICQNLGKIYNPLFIYGGTGLGKTHLLHAIGNEAKHQNPSLLIHYQTSDHFVNEFINCIRFDKSEQFRAKYQKIDLLLLDDVQFLSNKEQTQESFFHIFNALYEQQKQIVLSSDTFPKEITGLQNRLKSRLEWGLVADIQIPDLETKIAILKKKADAHRTMLPDEVADFIASRVISNIRELEGALIRVSAFSSLTNQHISLEMARKVLLNLSERKKEGVLLDNVLKAVAKHYAISINDIKSKKRHKDVAAVRQVTLYMMKKLTFCSLQAIGNYVGGRDHSTVIHAICKVESMIGQDASFAQKIKALEQEILMN